MADTITLENTKIIETVSALNNAMTGDGSPYKAMIDFVNTAALQNILDSAEKVSAITTMMANSVSNISLNVLTSAIEIEKSKLILEKDLELKRLQIELATQQKLTEAQQTAKAAYEVDTLLVDEHNLKQSQKSQIDSQKAMLDQQKLTEAQQTAIAAYSINTILPKEATLKEKQISVSEKQISGFDKDMYYKVLSKAGETTQMLAAAGATAGYEWLASTMKLSIEKMTDGKINVVSVGDNTTVSLNNSATDANGLGS